MVPLSTCLGVPDSFDFIKSIYEEDKAASFLFNYVVFQNLSVKSIEKFFYEFKFEDIDEVIWKSIASIATNNQAENGDRENRYSESYSESVIKKFEFQNKNSMES